VSSGFCSWILMGSLGGGLRRL